MLFAQKAEGIRFTAYTPYFILLIIILLLDIIALASYKFRVFQFRTSILSAIITIALQAWLVVDYLTVRSELTFKLTALFPLASAVFDILAARNIWADELMVRSASRLRAAKRDKKTTKQ